MGIGIFLHGKSLRDEKARSIYESIDGPTLKFKSAVFGFNHYVYVMEYKLGDDYFGVRCLLPKFEMVAKYDDIKLTREKTLFGSLIHVSMPTYPKGFKIYPKLAKKLESHSNGKFKYV